jgi:hypothetical protein
MKRPVKVAPVRVEWVKVRGVKMRRITNLVTGRSHYLL